jgi:hypothetical protein
LRFPRGVTSKAFLLSYHDGIGILLFDANDLCQNSVFHVASTT